jgi:hypothetical protein
MSRPCARTRAPEASDPAHGLQRHQTLTPEVQQPYLIPACLTGEQSPAIDPRWPCGTSKEKSTTYF